MTPHFVIFTINRHDIFGSELTSSNTLLVARNVDKSRTVLAVFFFNFALKCKFSYIASITPRMHGSFDSYYFTLRNFSLWQGCKVVDQY